MSRTWVRETKQRDRWKDKKDGLYQTREAIRRAKKRVFSLSLFGINKEEREPMCPEQREREDERTIWEEEGERGLYREMKRLKFIGGTQKRVNIKFNFYKYFLNPFDSRYFCGFVLG